MSREWTKEQSKAIDSKSRDLLVSAAAGSGKTAVLTERIIKKLTDKEHPADISRMLVVTFTKAAANELKERIAAALFAEMAKNPDDKRLERQYVLLGKAHISTIDGFCLDIVRRNFEKLGISADVRVSDTTQSGLLMEQVADSVIDGYYAGLDGYNDIDGFADFADNFITVDDSSLSKILINIFSSVSSFPRGIDFLLDSAEEYRKSYESGFLSTSWGKSVLERAERKLVYYESVFTAACDYSGSDGIYRKAYLPAFGSDLDFIKRSLKCLINRDTDDLKKLLDGYSPARLGAVKANEKTPDGNYFAGKRDDFKKFIKSFCDDFRYYGGEDIVKTAKRCRDITEKLYRFVKAFDTRYTLEKRKRGILDFGDIERLAFRLLVNENGEPTEEAKLISAEFDEVYIDEYQDVNKIQDMIFSAVSNVSSRFMVGDIKQSIYSFRSSEPSLFAGYRANDKIDKIYLTKNFRCSESVIGITNAVCGGLFGFVGKTVPYTEDDELKLGRTDSSPEEPELHIIECNGKAEERRRAEAKFAAQKVSELIKSGIEPKEIAILLRVQKGIGKIYEDALSELDIPSVNAAKDDLFVNPEILLMLDILNIIDNPTRDIYLAGALKSPVWNFSLTELIEIRSHCKKGSLYDALVKYTEDNDFAKGKHFLEKLNKYRSMINLPVDKLIWFILCDTNMFAVAAANETSLSTRKGNLLLFYEYARTFESGSYKGLYNFIRYINDIIESGSTVPSASEESENAVNIITIHHSKGLEYKAVIIPDSAKEKELKDAAKNILLYRSYGITFKLTDETGIASVNTVFRSAEADAMFDKYIDEEIRVLYVAMTRAKDKLILTATVQDSEKYLTGIGYDAKYSGKCSETYFINRSFMSWVLLTAGDKYTPTVTVMNHDGSMPEIPAAAAAETDSDESREYSEEVSRLENEYRRRFDFVYPYAAISSIPAKLSVSELYPAVLDEYADAAKPKDDEIKMKSPSFILGEKSTAAEKGTATHLFMQFCDFAMLDRNGIDEEISRLGTLNFIDAHTASLIDRDSVGRFMKSELYLSLLNSGFIKRELRFNIRLPASSFTEDPANKELFKDEKVLVQGIIDCIFTDSDGNLTLLDYKTDSVPYELRRDPDAFGELLISRHSRQLGYYRKAVEDLMLKKPDRVIIYSFAAGRVYEIPDGRLEKF